MKLINVIIDEPDEFETNNDCVALRLDRNGKPGTTGQWDDAVCNRPMHFVCQKQGTPIFNQS